MNNISKAFYPVDNNDGTYRIECRCIIYRAMLGKHPDWAKPQGDAKDGFNTKYYLLIEDDIASLATAQKRADDLNHKYSDILTKCEDTGDWTTFPFTDRPIIFYK
jgi:hypothetical protein